MVLVQSKISQVLGIIILLNTGRERYGSYLVELYNSYFIGNNNYPGTFIEAFFLLLNFSKEQVKGKEVVLLNKDEDRCLYLA